MTNEHALLAHWSVRQKLNHVSSVQFIYVALLCVTRRVCVRYILTINQFKKLQDDRWCTISA